MYGTGVSAVQLLHGCGRVLWYMYVVKTPITGNRMIMKVENNFITSWESKKILNTGMSIYKLTGTYRYEESRKKNIM